MTDTERHIASLEADLITARSRADAALSRAEKAEAARDEALERTRRAEAVLMEEIETRQKDAVEGQTNS